ncbi:response regulator [Robertkochia solimangrovi]|uniref:response regulator n=1 Tax=Robertkochia solimangrovi TaxID=2213046 RepID=UPI00117CEBD1|nr:response regulator [Robertkochia solimangrovi]TRZ46085.1 DNA-binding response regulator [Robertkochia solimangrovi]
MKKSPFRILLIDDHPLITEAYRYAVETTEIFPKDTLQFDSAHDIATAVHFMNSYMYNLIFLDIQLPPLPEEKLYSGEDLGLRIRKAHPETKIMMITTYNDHYRIQNIIKQVDPDGFIVKNDLSAEELRNGIKKVLTSPPFYSHRVLHSFRKFFSNDFIIDKPDRQLLFYLDQGATLGEISSLLSLSRAAIVKRKQRLIDIFDTAKGDDRQLLQAAREKGFI